MISIITTFINSAKLYIMGGLLALCVVLGAFLYISGLKLDKEKAAHAETISNYTAAQKEAEAIALRNKITVEEKYEQDKEQAAKDYSDLLSKYRTSLLRIQTSTSSTGGNNLPVSTDSSQLSNGAGEGAELPEGLEVPYTDLEICAENTAKASAWKTWYERVSTTPSKTSLDASE